MDYATCLDTTLAVTEGMKEIEHTLVEALILVIIVVFDLSPGWRATLIPLLAVPVSLVGTFALFPCLGFRSTLSLFGLVLAIGLVVDDAIVVVGGRASHRRAVAQDAAFKAMGGFRSGGCHCHHPGGGLRSHGVHSGITGRLYQQFAVTIAVSVVISAFNALTLSPALAALLLRPKTRGTGLLQKVLRRLQQGFRRGDQRVCRHLPVPGAQERARPGPARGCRCPGRIVWKSIPTSFL